MQFGILKKRTIEKIYIWLLCLALFFHVFNEISVSESIKLFHIPMTIASILVIFMANKNKVVFLNICIIVCLSLIGSLVSISEDSIDIFVKFVIIILGSSGLSVVNKDRVLSLLNILTPIVLISLLTHYYTGDYYRFTGWYNDPNYLCATLMVFLYGIVQLLFKTNKILMKIFLFIEIGIIAILISFSISRTGLLCFLIILIISFFKFFKKNILITIFVVGIFIMGAFQSGFFEDVYDKYTARMFETSDNIESAGEYRLKTSLQGVGYVIEHPTNLCFGVGLGGTFGTKVIEGKKHWHGDHNTYTSFFTEQGLVAFICYIILLLHMFKMKVKHKNWVDLIFLLVHSIFAMSISMKLYLPYWFLLFLLSSNTKCNKQIIS